MSDQPTFAGLKERWRKPSSMPIYCGDPAYRACADELEALEQRVRELLDELESSGGKGADGFYRYSINVENRLTALLGDKPAMSAPITDEYRKLSMQIAELWDLCRDDKANQLLADHDAAVRRQALEELAKRGHSFHLDLYAAYANHCAIQRKVPMTFHRWKRQGKPRTP